MHATKKIMLTLLKGNNFDKNTRSEKNAAVFYNKSRVVWNHKIKC